MQMMCPQRAIRSLLHFGGFFPKQPILEAPSHPIPPQLTPADPARGPVREARAGGARPERGAGQQRVQHSVVVQHVDEGGGVPDLVQGEVDVGLADGVRRVVEPLEKGGGYACVNVGWKAEGPCGPG